MTTTEINYRRTHEVMSRAQQTYLNDHAASAYKAGWDAYKAGQSGPGFLPSADHVKGWLDARNEIRDKALTTDRQQHREPDGDILFA